MRVREWIQLQHCSHTLCERHIALSIHRASPPRPKIHAIHAPQKRRTNCETEMKIMELTSRNVNTDWNQCGNICPARTGPLEGPTFPSEDRDVPYLARCPVRIAPARPNCAKLGKSQGSQPEFSPSSSRMRAGQTFPQ